MKFKKVVKSDFTIIRIPSLDFEIPCGTQKGAITTVEGIIESSISDLLQDQSKRKDESLELAKQIDEFLKQLAKLKQITDPFSIIFEDISGECYVENLKAPLKDDACDITLFKRTTDQNRLLGIFSENDNVSSESVQQNDFTLEQLQGEVLTFPTNCPECNSPCDTNMKLTYIPHFKEVVIMATVCEGCGHRTNEVKSSGGIEPKGVRIEVKVSKQEDFSRDLLKSETCEMIIPELELEVGATTLGGRFTTVEGIILAAKEQLSTSTVLTGDSTNPELVERMNNFVARLDEVLNGKHEVTLVLNDPAGNSYVQSLNEDGNDNRLNIIKYERTFEQNDELGLIDMKVDEY